MKRLGRILLKIGAVLLLAILAGTAFLYWQARQVPTGRPDYVALGSSFAAGIGLGPRLPGTPLVCLRSANGYPQQLARMRRLSLVDMSCSGATSDHVLAGGQIFLGPQIDAIGPMTGLVTMTAGGNDISYVGDLAIMVARRQSTLGVRAAAIATSAPRIDRARDYDGVRATLIAIVAAVRQRAPRATIILLTYPQILPPRGTCAGLGMSEAEVATMRGVGDRLAAATGAAARQAGARFIDMQALGAAHHACARDPWVNGWDSGSETPFHPTLAGATAMARAIDASLGSRD